MSPPHIRESGTFPETQNSSSAGRQLSAERRTLRLTPLESVFRVLPIVAYDRDADAAGNFSKQEVIREARQVDPPAVSPLEMKLLWVGDGPLDE